MRKKIEPYKDRSIRFIEYWNIGDWRLKVYGISYKGEYPNQQLIDSSRIIAKNRLEESANLTNHYNVGFVGIHEGKTGNFVFIDWWADENELHHHVYVSSSENSELFEYLTPAGLTACVWDLLLINHERNAWVAHILESGSTENIKAYLNTTLNLEV